MNRPKGLNKNFGWCKRKGHGVIVFKETGCHHCKTERERKAKGLCMAQLGHGPGHQSKTFCERTGEHKIHTCVFGRYNEVATWIGSVNKIKFTGYFDDAPEVKGE